MYQMVSPLPSTMHVPRELKNIRHVIPTLVAQCELLDKRCGIIQDLITLAIINREKIS